MFSLLRRTMRLVVILLVFVSGISCREHARHQQHLKDVHSAKKFNIVTQSRKQDSMMVMMKGQDGAAGQNGTQGDSGSAGRPGPPGPAGFPGTPGVCTKEQCESNELKLLIQRVLVVEKYVKDNQNPTGSQPRVQPTPQVSAKPGVKICPTTPKTNPTPGSSPGQCQPAPAPTVPAGSPQGPNSPQPQPSKAAAPPASSPVPAPAQGQPAPAPAPAPASGPAVPAGLPQGPKSPPPQPSKAAAQPVASPVPAPAQGQPAVPAGSPQVLWGTFTPSAASVPFSSPLGLTIQSTLEAPGTLYGGNGQIDIQGVLTPQVSVQSYPGNPGTASAAVQPGTAVKKSSISSDGAVTKPKHAHKKSTHHSRTHKS